MTLIAPGARRRGVTITRPYNAATYLAIQTPDATGQSTHPSVVDMLTPWNGYRWWMAHTPYAGSVVSLENPCILASNDRVTWVEPAGIANPIDPWPGGAGYNSDPELIFDPDSGRMVCYWRDYSGAPGVAGNLVFCYSTSLDGVTWTPQADALALTYPGAGIFSPAVLRVAAGDWRMWNVANPGTSQVYTAASYTGPWTLSSGLTFNGTSTGGVTGGLWHWDIIRHGGIFYGLVIANRSLNAASIYAMTSTDGIAWAINPTPVLRGRTDWDRQLYRPTLTMAGGGVMDVWYSALAPAASGWRIGHTHIPLSEWPAPPA